jgi:phage I-like protein
MELRPITNRDFKLPDDGWIQVAPIGEYPNSKAGIIQVIDKDACDAMVNRFNEEAKVEHFPGLLLDFDHMSSDVKAPSTAGGWIEALENRDDGNPENPANGLWAKVRWSTDGEAAVKGGNYRLISPVWNRSQCEDLGKNRFRPQRLDRAALTNDPVLKGMCPVSNRADGTADNEDLKARLEKAEKIIEAIQNAGTSAGAHKGWETRRGALSKFHSDSASSHRLEAQELRGHADRAEAKGASKDADRLRVKADSHEKLADNHEKLATSYKSKAKVSGAKAHINAELEKLKKVKSTPKASAPPKGESKDSQISKLQKLQKDASVSGNVSAVNKYQSQIEALKK